VPSLRSGSIINGVGALSRTTRDDGAAIMICARCGERESLYGRDPANQVRYTEWPVHIDRLVEEERQLITFFRNSELTMMEINPVEEDLGLGAE
jgi:hypothetical protein